MMKQLKQLASIKKGSGSTFGTYTVCVKADDDQTIEAVELILSVLATTVRRASRRVFVVKMEV